MAQRVVNFRGGEQIVVPFDLCRIVTSHNPRKPVRKLQRLGIVPLDFLHDYALSDDLVKVEEYVTKMALEPEIVSLARSIQRIGQSQPIILRSFRSQAGRDGDGKQLYEVRAGIAAGERRVLACGLLEAVRRLAVAKNLNTGDTLKVADVEYTVTDRKSAWTVDAIAIDSSRLTVEEASEIGWDENAQRVEMNDLDWGEKFDAMLRAYNPVTQKLYTIQEVADKYGKNYHWVRGRAALPYLPVEQQEQVEDKECNITEACTLALRYKAKALKEVETVEGQPAPVVPDQGAVEGEPSTSPVVSTEGAPEQPSQPKPADLLPTRRERKATLALAEVYKLFDTTPVDNTERRKAFAEVMGLSLEQAAKESIARKEAEELKRAKAVERNARKKPAA